MMGPMRRGVRTAIEIAVILAAAAGVAFVPGGTNAASALGAAVDFLFGAGVLWVLVRGYRESRFTLSTFPERHRALLYGAIAAGFLTVAARPRLWESTAGTFAFWLVLGLCAYALFLLYRFARRY